jgi:hypothetical protein
MARATIVSNINLLALQGRSQSADGKQALASCPALTAFQARCEARAILCAVGELSLHEGVDVLQHDALASGLVDTIGQDTVQAVMAVAFGEVPRHG